MDVFDLRNQVIADYAAYVRSFVTIRDQRIEELVSRELNGGFLWPDPLVQLNPSFEPGESLEQLIREGLLHPECLNIFRKKDDPDKDGGPLQLHRHQVESIRAARAGDNYVLTTGTGSGKSLSYIVPIVDHVLRRGSRKGIQAIIVYPMNALANSQMGELTKFLCNGYPAGRPPVTFRRYTGQEKDAERKEIIADPPDILLTNYVMLELVLTRPFDRNLVKAAKGLQFLVLDELHTYRGRQGADVAMLVRRVRQGCDAENLQHVGTSATLSSVGSWQDQKNGVADLASRLFGAPVRPERVIGETLRRVTQAHDLGDPRSVEALRARLATESSDAGQSVREFVENPLSSWIESTLGLHADSNSGRLVRSRPMPLAGTSGAATQLSALIGLPVKRCEQALREALLTGYRLRDGYGRPLFAFRLHQFVAKGECVYASLEPEGVRHVTLQAQLFVPNSERKKSLLPLAFCRECGQEYFVVHRRVAPDGRVAYVPRELSDRQEDDEGEPGFLFINSVDPWPSEAAEVVERLPDSWLELRDGRAVVRDARRDRLPKGIFLSPSGHEGGGDLRAHFLQAPFLFCLRCRVDYDAHQSSDFGKLATLGSEGRSTATTILSLSTVRRLRQDGQLDPEARKLLSFTDNRQDASLQAGHFNDFIELALLRTALRRAVEAAGNDGLRHEHVTRSVFDALSLPLEAYAANPKVEYLQLEETQRALREVLGYYLYRDLRRGWRVTSPNLEQCGLLDLDYLSLPAFCADEPKWKALHPALATARPATRERVCRVLLDYMRRELAIRVKYLQPEDQESTRQLSTQYLVSPWALDEQETMERSRIVLPRPRGAEFSADSRFAYLSPRGGLGLYLKRSGVFPEFKGPLKTEEAGLLIHQLLEALVIPGLVHRVLEPRNQGDVGGYQLNASALVWRAGDGKRGFHDPVRVPNAPDEGLRTNPYFVEFYKAPMSDMVSLHAREHTAQVPNEIRQYREDAFRKARLPILYCSPTMELGVDINQLNVVNMRNVPPTPANYAQRSGRAGRSGQPAFVFTYCSAGSPHDQYFFKRSDRMVSGSVATPRIDLSNEDLVIAHVHAIWLAESGLGLGNSLREVLDVSGDRPTLDVLASVCEKLDDRSARKRARMAALHALGPAIEALVRTNGTPDEWLRQVLDQIPRRFQEACERWRGLYRGALSQAERQTKILHDASREARDRDRAKQLRDEAETQLRLLLEASEEGHSDFYSYRYFASEGFLPGYSFPRLPLSAYIPGRRRKQGQEEFLSRPRFLAISEFGPRSIIYHEGSRYVINKVMLPVDTEDATLTRKAVQCKDCGYLHPLGDAPAPDLCERCDSRLPLPFTNLFRMQNVSTKRRDKINSDEEERLRLGYEIRTGVRFADRAGTVSAQQADLKDAGGMPLATLLYGHSATLWRLNMGWRRRRNKEQTGYVLDVERGYWAKNQEVESEPEDPLSPRTTRVIPYVEDRRNCLIIEPTATLAVSELASLQAALKTAIQAQFQLEDGELAAEPLPDSEIRRSILLYEAAEGGAGVLRHLVEDVTALPEVARTALDLCHFDPGDGADRRRSLNSKEDCEAACYDCLLSYYNQRDHRLLDRKLLPGVLLAWAGGAVAAAPVPRPREEQVERLMRLTGSDLERRWLRLADRLDLRLPSDAQTLIDSCHVSPDFLYRQQSVAIFVDGPHHDEPAQREIDARQQDALEDAGYTVIRFHHAADWEDILRRSPGIFGTGAPPPQTR